MASIITINGITYRKTTVMTTLNMSNHATKDRMNRLFAIYDNIGFPERIICSSFDIARMTENILFDNGMVLVRSLQNNIVVTVIPPDIKRATAIFRQETDLPKLPSNLHKVISRNTQICKKIGL